MTAAGPPPVDPEISVVVPTYRRPDLLERCLGSLAAQDLPADRHEVIVVDDGSADRTTDVLGTWSRGLPQLRALTQSENRGPAAARNRAWREARAPVVLFLDDDIVVPPALVRTHVELHRSADDPHLGILGRVDWAPELAVTRFMHWLDRSGLQFAYDTWLRPGPVDPPYAAFYTANLSMRRSLLEASGGFDERFPFPAYEDIELAWRLARHGFRMEYRPEAQAYHSRPIDLPTFRRRMAMVAESAELIAAVQPDFPVDHGFAERGGTGARRLWLLRARFPLAVLTGDDDTVARRYAAEIAAAYRSGRERGQARVAERVGGSGSTC